MKAVTFLLGLSFMFVLSCKNERDVDVVVPTTEDTIILDDHTMDETVPVVTDTMGTDNAAQDYRDTIPAVR
jgi:hypothetical protein